MAATAQPVVRRRLRSRNARASNALADELALRGGLGLATSRRAAFGLDAMTSAPSRPHIARAHSSQGTPLAVRALPIALTGELVNFVEPTRRGRELGFGFAPLDLNTLGEPMRDQPGGRAPIRERGAGDHRDETVERDRPAFGSLGPGVKDLDAPEPVCPVARPARSVLAGARAVDAIAATLDGAAADGAGIHTQDARRKGVGYGIKSHR